MQYVTWADDRGLDLRGADISPRLTGVLGGLVQQVPGAAARIRTGIVSGPVTVTVQRADRAPAEVSPGWEDVVEVGCRVTDGQVAVAGPYADDPDSAAALVAPGIVWFRLRVHARGRDAGDDLTTTDPHEEYLLITWPAEPSPPTVVAAHSRIARRNLTAPPPSAAAVRGVDASSDRDRERRAAAQDNLLRISREHQRGRR
ncbi:hypothetical protein [Cellulomonas taurus]|uniref:hypothetical protein n=1 Tax=Cellulomonas taurus TaxID=2729175 RepID=UPI00145D6A96|nr:hypothetical protein [Cellulomonas taurus]